MSPAEAALLLYAVQIDFEHADSSAKDGWLFSDFYLFDRPLSVVGSSHQVRLTSEDPAVLVAKYTEFAHENLKQDRRMVLNEGRSIEIQQAVNVRVVERLALLKHFNSTITERASVAAISGEQLIILLMGYGEMNFLRSST